VKPPDSLLFAQRSAVFIAQPSMSNWGDQAPGLWTRALLQLPDTVAVLKTSSEQRPEHPSSCRLRKTHPPSAACLRLLPAWLPPPRGPLHHPTRSRAAFPTCPHHRFTGLTAPCHTQFLGQIECITLCVPGSSFTHKATNSGINNITSVYYIVSYL
jgi:hypothetical protein